MDTCEGESTMESAGRVKSSTYLDEDVLAWLKERSRRIERPVSWQIRDILRAAMYAEATQQRAAS